MHRSLKLLWVGETTSALGTSIAAVSLPLVAVEVLHIGPLLMGVLEASVWLPWLLIGLPAGVWVDRWSRRRTMVVNDGVAMLAFAAVPLADWVRALSVWVLVGVALAVGTTGVFFSVAYRAYLPTVVAESKRQEANALLQGSESAAGVAGSGLGGMLAAVAGPLLGLGLNAVSFLVSAVCLLRIHGDEPARVSTGRAKIGAEVKAGLVMLIGDAYLRVIAGYAAVVNAVLAGVGGLQVLFLVHDLHSSPVMVGLLLAVEGAGGVCGAGLSARLTRRYGSARALLICAMGLFPAGLLMPFAFPGRGLVFFGVGAAIPAAAVVAFSVIVTTFRQSYCPAEILGRITASGRVLAYATVPLGAVSAGALGGAIGVRGAIAVMVILGALAGVILCVGPLTRSRDLPRSTLSDGFRSRRRIRR